MSLTKLETETVINFNDAEDTASITTRQRRVKTRMKKLGVEPSHKQADYEVYIVPKNWVKISPPKKVSTKQRELARERMIKIHSERDLM